MAVKALAPEKIRHDLLGKVFHELIPFEVRKAVAAFYTNNEAAEILAQLAIERAYAKVLDLACGSGTLLVAAYRRKRELLLKEKGEFTLEDHKRFLEQDLTGIDIMPFAAHMAVVHLALQALAAGHEAEKVRIAVWDSTELEPGQTIPAISRELKAAYKRPTLELFFEGKPPVEEAYVEKGAVTLEGIGGEQIPLEKADVVIMNPPFTRQERLPKEYKDALMKRLKDYIDYLHGQLGLYGYFILLADKFTKENGRIALVLPATILRVKSAEGVRNFLAEKYRIEHIITTWQRAAFSESAQFREILLIARKPRENGEEHHCVVTVLKKMPASLEEAKAWAWRIKNFVSLENETYEDENFTIYKIGYEELKMTLENMFTLISTHTPLLTRLWTKVAVNSANKFTTFHEYLKSAGAKIKRGIETARGGKVQPLTILSDKSMAIKKSDIWITKQVNVDSLVARHRFIEAEVTVPLRAVRRALRRISGVKNIEIKEKADYVISETFPHIQDFLKLATGKSDTNFMNKWKTYVDERLGNLIIVRRMDISAKGSCMMAFYSPTLLAPPGISWSIRVLSNEDAKILALWFNSSINILQTLINRKETRGAFLQIDEYTLKTFKVVNPSNLNNFEKELLLEMFNKVRDVSFPCVLEQLRSRFWARVEIDRAILKVLGFNEQETNQILDHLYPALTKEIEQLKTLMQG
jgi:tRNA1(Val) A37 N6-methylase TrmN6